MPDFTSGYNVYLKENGELPKYNNNFFILSHEPGFNITSLMILLEENLKSRQKCLFRRNEKYLSFRTIINISYMEQTQSEKVPNVYCKRVK